MPRILAAAEWEILQRGLEQRVKAINAYIKDIYGRREILKAGIVPEDLVFQNPVFRPEMNGQKVPHDIYVHIAGIDIVRVDADDLLRARGQCAHALRRLLHAGEPRDHAAAVSGTVRAPPRRAGGELSRRAAGDAEVGRAADRRVAIRPSCCSRPASTTRPITSTRSSPTSSASSWSKAATCSSRTSWSTCAPPQGPKRVDVIYRRIDDDFLDPLAFRPDYRARRAGPDVGLPGRQRHARQCGRHRHRRRQGGLQLHAGDREVLSRRGADPEERADLALPRARAPRYVLDHLDELVVKEVHGSGGYGMLIGPKADKATIEAFRAKLKSESEELHRPADAGALDLPDLRRGRRRAAPRRSAPVRAHRPRPASASCRAA